MPIAAGVSAADEEIADMLPRAAACLRLLEQVRLAALAPEDETDWLKVSTVSDVATDRRSDAVDESVIAGGSSPLAGLSVGRFQVIRELGSGGHGIVVLARDPVLHRDVALKIPRPNHSSCPTRGSQASQIATSAVTRSIDIMVNWKRRRVGRAAAMVPDCSSCRVAPGHRHGH